MRVSTRIVVIVVAIVAHAGAVRAQEPNVKLASTWWPDLTNVVTPVAWRDHPHRFCVVYDGTIIGLPVSEKLTRTRWGEGEPLEGIQLSFAPSDDGTPPPQRDQPEWLALPD